MYKNWALPGSYSFLSGKIFEIYNKMFTNLNETAIKLDLSLNPSTISIDFELGMIKAVKSQFPNAKILGCHFHFSSGIYHKLVEIGFKANYSEDAKFKEKIRMFMTMPFLKLEDIYRAWVELLQL